MKIFESISHLKGQAADAAARLHLTNLKATSNSNHNYVAYGFQGDIPVVLKLGLDINCIKQEASALTCFKDHGAAKLIVAEENLLLLERVTPGIELKSYFPSKDMESIKILCQIMQKLHKAQVPTNHNFPHLRDWFSCLDGEWAIAGEQMQKARSLRDRFFTPSKSDVLLHGDLHHSNILQHKNNWLVIDPKGVIGNPLFETTIFICNPLDRLLQRDDWRKIIIGRIKRFAIELKVSANEIQDLCFMRAILGWIWALQDDSDIICWQSIAQLCYQDLAFDNQALIV